MARAILCLLVLLEVSCTTPSIVATRNIQLGDEMNNTSRYVESITYYEEYLKLAPQLGLYRNPLKESEVCRKLAHAHSTQGKYRQALRYASRALAIDTAQHDNDLNVIEDYREIGLINAFTGDYISSRENLIHSLQLCEGMEKSAKDQKKFSIADTYLALAQVQLSTGDFSECEQHVVKALALYNQQSEKILDVMEGQLVMGIIAREKGNLEDATRWLKRSQQLAEQANVNSSRQSQAMGELSFLKGEWEEGLRFYLTSLKEAERSQIKPQLVMACIRAGDAYQKIGDQEKANQYYKKAFSLQLEMKEDSSALLPSLNMRLGNVQRAYDEFKWSGSAMGAALASLRLAEILQEKSKVDSAENMAKRALEYFVNSENKEGVARSNFQLGRICAATNRHSMAMSYFKIALQQTNQLEITWKCWNEIGLLQERQDRYDSARVSYRKSIEIIEKHRGNLSVEEFKSLFSASNVAVYDRLILLLLKNKDRWKSFSQDSAIVEAFDLNERARSRTFLDMLGNNKIQPKSSTDVSLLDEEQLLGLKIQQLSKELYKGTTNESYSRLKHELTETESSYNDLLERIKLNNPAYEGMMSIPPPSLKQIQSILDDQSLLVEYWVSKEEIVMWLISRGSIHTESIKFPEAQLVREVTFARKVIAGQMESESEMVLKKLYNYLITPILPRLSGYKRLIIVPHKSLHFLPFEALTDEHEKFLLERQVTVQYAPSSAVLFYCVKRKVDRGNKFVGLAIGNEEIGGFPGLPGTELEVNLLAQIYPDLVKKTRNEFTEGYLKSSIHQFNYTHIATHGVFNIHQPLYSYILMSPDASEDGHLSVQEIFGLNINSKLVTLSACETGLGKISNGDELIGLSRAFIYGGAPAVVVSLWKVDDATTAMLMTRFYGYMNSGVTPAESLSLAKLDVLNKNFHLKPRQRGTPLEEEVFSPIKERDLAELRRPYYWAAFVIIGNGQIK